MIDLIHHPIVTGAIAGASIGLSTYAAKAAKGETFDAGKLARTVMIGVTLGAWMTGEGKTLDASNWEASIVAYGGVVAVTDQALKVLWRLVKKVTA